jgi:hypothetical protein
MKQMRTIFGLLFVFFLLINVSIAQNEVIDFNTDNWRFQQDAEIVQFAGRTALNGSAYLKDADFLNGTIEVDIWTTGQRNFGGLMFRIQSFQEYERCWFRIHKANGAVQDGLQYAPTFNGVSCWQLNGGSGGISPVNLPHNKWVHLKMEILNDTARLYVEDMKKPVMVMDDLQLGLKKGSVGPGVNMKGSIYFSNFSYRADNQCGIELPEEKQSPNIMTRWQLSPPYKVKDFAEIENYPAVRLAVSQKWIVPDVEPSGLVNITKYHRQESRTPPSCTMLRTTIIAEKDKLVKMNFGYSDAVAIFLNQQPLFWGNNAWRSRNMADSGWISYNDAAFLNLRKGENELLIVVADVFGGWGFQAKLNSQSPVTHGFNR